MPLRSFDRCIHFGPWHALHEALVAILPAARMDDAQAAMNAQPADDLVGRLVPLLIVVGGDVEAFEPLQPIVLVFDPLLLVAASPAEGDRQRRIAIGRPGRRIDLSSTMTAVRELDGMACQPNRIGSQSAAVGFGFAPLTGSRIFAIASTPSGSRNGKTMLPRSSSAIL